MWDGNSEKPTNDLVSARAWGWPGGQGSKAGSARRRPGLPCWEPGLGRVSFLIRKIGIVVPALEVAVKIRQCGLCPAFGEGPGSNHIKLREVTGSYTCGARGPHP